MIEIHRHEQNGILQGFSFWAYPDPIIILVHEQGVWHSKTKYYGWGSFGAINANVECTGFETMEQADQYIADNNLLFSGEHFFFTDSEVVIFRSNVSGESSPVIVADGVIQQTQSADIIFGEPQKVVDWIMAENFDISGIVQWNDLVGQAVKKDKLAVFNGVLYICINPHTVQSDWMPDIAVSLWTKHLPDGVIGDWRQPQGQHDAYKLGMRVRQVGWIWEVTETDANGNNVWEPGVFGWTQIEQIEVPEPPANPCDSIAVWDANEDYNQMEVGQLRKVLVNGIWKVYAVKNPGFVHYDPSGPNGGYGWTYQYDCVI